MTSWDCFRLHFKIEFGTKIFFYDIKLLSLQSLSNNKASAVPQVEDCRYFFIMKVIDELKGGFYGLIICTLITMCSGCKTKKAITSIAHKRTFDSVAVVRENKQSTYSIIDTTRTTEHTKMITEYVFSGPSSGVYGVCVADTMAMGGNTFVPMVVRKADGTLQINYGLMGIKQSIEQNKTEQKGVSKCKENKESKDNKTKVAATENDRRKDRQVEQIAVSKPFDFWQLVIGVSILFAVIVALYYLYKRVPSVRNITRKILDRIRK